MQTHALVGMSVLLVASSLDRARLASFAPPAQLLPSPAQPGSSVQRLRTFHSFALLGRFVKLEAYSLHLVLQDMQQSLGPTPGCFPRWRLLAKYARQEQLQTVKIRRIVKLAMLATYAWKGAPHPGQPACLSNVGTFALQGTTAQLALCSHCRALQAHSTAWQVPRQRLPVKHV